MITTIKGITVKLIEKIDDGTVDGFNRPNIIENEVYVDNVLVTPTENTDVVDVLNMTGKKAVYTLAIPKNDDHNWEDNDVEFFGQRFHVFTPLVKGIDDLIPLDWNGKVMVERYEQ